MHKALFYEKLKEGQVRCVLCPHFCQIKDGARGFCGVRLNQGGELFTLNYSKVSSLALDPVEKKPLYHFHQGEFILSVGTVGCNLSCLFCQNWSISKNVESPVELFSPQDLIDKAKRFGSFGIAYTYNEPFIWYEFVVETTKLARAAGLENVLVTNGYVTPGALAELLPSIDAMNIDLKSIRDEFYRKTCSGSVAEVLETIKRSVEKCHVELTNLIIPALNDSEEDLHDLVDWIYNTIGSTVPLHFSRYFPCYKMNIKPTPVETLERAAAIARKKLKHVYLGNV